MTLQDEKMTTHELAIQLKRSPETLVRWRRLKQGPPFIRMQGRVLYDRQAVERWLQDQIIQVSANESRLIERIRRKLKADGQALRRTRQASAAENQLGEWYIIDVDRNTVVASHCDIESLASELGVFA